MSETICTIILISLLLFHPVNVAINKSRFTHAHTSDANRQIFENRLEYNFCELKNSLAKFFLAIYACLVLHAKCNSRI